MHDSQPNRFIVEDILSAAKKAGLSVEAYLAMESQKAADDGDFMAADAYQSLRRNFIDQISRN